MFHKVKKYVIGFFVLCGGILFAFLSGKSSGRKQEKLGGIDKKIKEIDSKQIFQSDDEIGWFFNGIKEIQELINEYNINHKP